VQKDNLHVLEKYIDAQADIREHSSYRILETKGEEEVLFDLIEYLDCVIDKLNNLYSSIGMEKQCSKKSTAKSRWTATFQESLKFSFS
jgi:molybdopterin/thiamine biosynthesis adenylyltransferase